MYDLYGVLVHQGHSVHAGHYYCFVRAGNGLWYQCDDTRVGQVSERSALKQKAYILFYVRRHPRVPPGAGPAVQRAAKQALRAAAEAAAKQTMATGQSPLANGHAGAAAAGPAVAGPQPKKQAAEVSNGVVANGVAAAAPGQAAAKKSKLVATGLANGQPAGPSQSAPKAQEPEPASLTSSQQHEGSEDEAPRWGLLGYPLRLWLPDHAV